MKLRKKSFLLIALSLAAAMVAMWCAIRFFALRSFDQMEEYAAIRTVSRARRLLSHEQEDLALSVRDRAASERLVRAIDQRDLEFISQRFSASALQNLRWSFFMLVNERGEILVSAERSGTGSWLPLDPHNRGELTKVCRLVDRADVATPLRVLEATSGAPCIFSAARVQRLSGSLPPVGTLVAAIRLGEEEINRIASMADTPLQILTPADPLFAVFATKSKNSEEARRIFASKTREGARAGFAPLADASGAPVALLQAKLDTSIREESDRFTRLLIGVLAAVAVLLYVLIDRVVLRTVIVRLARLSSGLKEVQRSVDLSPRLPVEGKDEIATLAREVNRLLTSVESSQRTLERVNAEMQQRVAERTAALAEANVALEADIAERISAERERARLREQLLQAHKMEAVGTLAGGIAHDFNNILTGILGHAQLIEADLPTDSQVRANLRHVIAAAERAASLVHQILAFSRQSPGERRRIAVSHVAREALSLLRAALPAGIQIKYLLETEADTVEADPTQLHQVFMNLGANAGHAMGSRGGELTVRLGRLKQPAAGMHGANPIAAGDYVCISVSDTGCGMTPEVMERIFDPFFSTKPVNEGTGLGLAVVHGIISDHGGTIDVESEIGKGTCFRILLPGEGGAAEQRTGEAPVPFSGSERLLLVDDEEIVVSVAAQQLQRLGYKVTALQNSAEALGRFELTPDDFDLVITDQTMPHLSGLQLLEAIKQLRPKMPVILATGYSPEVAGMDAASAGLVGIIGKPIDFVELTSLIRHALDSDKVDAAV